MFKNQPCDLAGPAFAHLPNKRGNSRINGVVFYKKRATMYQVAEGRAETLANAGNNKAVEIASRIEAMPVERVRKLYHELVDKGPNLSSSERFEFERVKARLDAEDLDAEQEARERSWELRRTEILDSIEDLLDRLRQSHLA